MRNKGSRTLGWGVESISLPTFALQLAVVCLWFIQNVLQWFRMTFALRCGQTLMCANLYLSVVTFLQLNGRADFDGLGKEVVSTMRTGLLLANNVGKPESGAQLWIVFPSISMLTFLQNQFYELYLHIWNCSLHRVARIVLFQPQGAVRNSANKTNKTQLFCAVLVLTSSRVPFHQRFQS